MNDGEADLWRAYAQTIFRVVDGGRLVTFQVGTTAPQLDRLLERHGATRWAHVTAWNPASTQLPASENELRQRALVARLKEAGFAVLDGDGIDPEGRWPPEQTAFVIGIGVADARALGRDYGQLAIVAGELGGPVRLVACLDVTTKSHAADIHVIRDGGAERQRVPDGRRAVPLEES